MKKEQAKVTNVFDDELCKHKFSLRWCPFLYIRLSAFCQLKHIWPHTKKPVFIYLIHYVPFILHGTRIEIPGCNYAE